MSYRFTSRSFKIGWVLFFSNSNHFPILWCFMAYRDWNNDKGECKKKKRWREWSCFERKRNKIEATRRFGVLINKKKEVMLGRKKGFGSLKTNKGGKGLVYFRFIFFLINETMCFILPILNKICPQI